MPIVNNFVWSRALSILCVISDNAMADLFGNNPIIYSRKQLIDNNRFHGKTCFVCCDNRKCVKEKQSKVLPKGSKTSF